jgi:hypothetical protein
MHEGRVDQKGVQQDPNQTMIRTPELGEGDQGKRPEDGEHVREQDGCAGDDASGHARAVTMATPGVLDRGLFPAAGARRVSAGNPRLRRKPGLRRKTAH